MNIELKQNELIEELEGGIRIIANTALYRYTSDSIRLEKSVKAGAKDKILDLCSGGGVISLMLAHTTNALKIDALEIQPDLCDLARRSIELNGLQDRITAVCGDLIDFDGGQNYDIVVCNPPYYKVNTGDTRKMPTCDIARHELRCTLRDIAAAFDKALKYGGVGYMVHKCERLNEVLADMTAFGLEPKELTLYYSGAKNCDTFVVKVKKGAKPGIKVNCSAL